MTLKPNKKLMTQGDRLRYLRETCSLRRNKFAEKYNLSLATVRSWELDISNISDRLCEKLIGIYKQESILIHKEWIKNGAPPHPIKLSVDNSVEQLKDLDSIQKEIDHFLSISDERFVLNIQSDLIPPCIEMHDVIGIEKISIEDLSHKESRLIVVGDPKSKNYKILLTALDEHGSIYATNLSFSNSMKKDILILNRNEPLYDVIWLRKIKTSKSNI